MIFHGSEPLALLAHHPPEQPVDEAAVPMVSSLLCGADRQIHCGVIRDPVEQDLGKTEV